LRVLVDTHALVWWWLKAGRLSRRAAAVLADRRNTVLVSAVSGYEITLKQRRGRLPGALPEDLDHAIVADGFAPLPISLAHAVAAGALPDSHRDPFDRLLLAQARLEGLAIVSSDEAFAAYGVRVVW
jgi:PIN domain nuclease of toxin-antitoxin system